MKTLFRISGVFIAMFFLLTTPLITYAEGGEKERRIGNFTIKHLDYTEAPFLKDQNSSSPLGDYKTEGTGSLIIPKIEVINLALLDVLSQLEDEGVNIEELITEDLRYKIINVDMRDVRAHAFMGVTPPTIYMYGELNYRLGDKEVYEATIHELAHFIEKIYFDEEARDSFRELREIPAEWGNQDTLRWGQRFSEIFAEDFTSLFVEDYDSYSELANMPEEMKPEFKDLIVTELKEKFGEWRYENELQEYIAQNKQTFGITTPMYTDNYNDWIDQEIAGTDLKTWVNTYLNTNNTRIYSPNVPEDFVSKEGLTQHLDLVLEALEQNTLTHKKYHWKYELEHKETELGKARVLLQTLGITPPDLNIQADKYLTKQEVAYLVARSLDLPTQEGNSHTFKDVPKDAKYSKEIATLTSFGVIKGESHETFGWDKEVSREQIASIIARSHKLKANNTPSYKDRNKVKPYALEGVDALYEHKILQGDQNNHFNPTQNIRYNELQLILYRTYLSTTNEKEVNLHTNNAYHNIKNWLAKIENTLPPSNQVTNGDFFQIVKDIEENN